MASVSQLNPYQCDQCGTTNIVAAPVLYQQGHAHIFCHVPFRDESILFCSSRSTARSSRIWTTSSALGNTNMLYFLLGLRRSCRHSRSSQVPDDARGHGRHFLTSGLVCLGGMFLNFRRIARYNREVYPRLHWNWEHTYICSAADGSASSPRSSETQAHLSGPIALRLHLSVRSLT